MYTEEEAGKVAEVCVGIAFERIQSSALLSGFNRAGDAIFSIQCNLESLEASRRQYELILGRLEDVEPKIRNHPSVVEEVRHFEDNLRVLSEARDRYKSSKRK